MSCFYYGCTMIGTQNQPNWAVLTLFRIDQNLTTSSTWITFTLSRHRHNSQSIDRFTIPIGLNVIKQDTLRTHA